MAAGILDRVDTRVSLGSGKDPSENDVVDDLTMDLGQAAVNPVVSLDEFFVVDSGLIENAGV
jgi:hypothetical protein